VLSGICSWVRWISLCAQQKTTFQAGQVLLWYHLNGLQKWEIKHQYSWIGITLEIQVCQCRPSRSMAWVVNKYARRATKEIKRQIQEKKIFWANRISVRIKRFAWNLWRTNRKTERRCLRVERGLWNFGETVWWSKSDCGSKRWKDNITKGRSREGKKKYCPYECPIWIKNSKTWERDWVIQN